MSEKLYYTVDEAAEKLEVSKETIRRYVRTGRLTAVIRSRKSGFQIPVDLIDNFDSNIFNNAADTKIYLDRQRKALTALREHYEMEINLIDEILSKLS